MIVPMVANREVVGVLPIYAEDSFRIPSVIVRDKRNRRVKVMLSHQMEKGFKIQKAIVRTQERIINDDRCVRFNGMPALLAEDISQGHSVWHKSGKMLIERCITRVLIDVRDVFAGEA